MRWKGWRWQEGTSENYQLCFEQYIKAVIFLAMNVL